MQNKVRRFIGVLLFVVIAVNGIAFTNHAAYAAVNPQKVNDAIDKFAGALGKLSANDASANIGKIANFCSRLGGLTSAASGVIGILQMAGVIKDPTMQMIGQVLDAVKDMQTTLDNMNRTLNQIAQELINIQVAQQEIARNNAATQMSTNWNNFNTNYTEKLQVYVDEYQAKINSGIADWWKQASHEGVYVLMVKKYTEENSLTYSKKKYSEGLPAQSEISGDIVSTDWSIGIPAEYMPNTSAVTFNIDTYRDDFKKIMVTALENAIKDNKLASNCGALVKSEYSGSSKQAMLESYADNVLNTVIYKISCEVMTANTSWVARVITLYKQYCDNIMQQNSGINAFLNYIYLTHAFEGEVKNLIEEFLDDMVVQAGIFGQFALTCAGQDSLQTTATKDQLREYFTNTVISLDNRKSKAITGHNNYCYITGSVLKAAELQFSSSMDVRTTVINEDAYDRGGPPPTYKYNSCHSNSWRVTSPSTVPSIVDSVYMSMLYRYYTKFSQKDAEYSISIDVLNIEDSFDWYLQIHGVLNAYVDGYYSYDILYDLLEPRLKWKGGNTIYMTNYREQENFAFNEGISMQAKQLLEGGDYFTEDKWYKIDVGTGSKVERDYYEVHDKVTGDLFDSSNGQQTTDTVIAARAFYGESHRLWNEDEVFSFASDGVSQSVQVLDHSEDSLKRDHYLKRVDFSKTIYVLTSTSSRDLNGDEDDPENPFFAFDMVSFTPLTYQMGPYYVNTSKDITEVLLESDSFPYTGLPIEPAVTVFASDDVVPEDGYTVTYLDNIESGDSAIVRVEGKGDYSGIISTHFTITEDASSVSGVRSSSSSGCEAMSGVGLLLGLVFAVRKFRRR